MTGRFGQGLLDQMRVRAQQVAAGEASPDVDIVPTSTDDVWELLRALFRFSVDGVAVSHRQSGILIEVSDSLCALTGFTRAQLLGRTARELGLMDEDGISALARHNAEHSVEGVYEAELRTRSGRRRTIEFSQQLLGPDYLVITARDVTRRKQLEADLRTLAATDPLTGLLNRRRFTEEVSRVINESTRFGEPVTLVVIDLDGLKTVNDQHGHQAGDAALRALAEAMIRHIRDTDFAGRLGGDEFAVLLTRSGEQGAKRVVQSLLTDLGHLDVLVTADLRLRMSASIGAATGYPPLEFDTLLADADRDMYRAKARTRPRATDTDAPTTARRRPII